MRVLVCHASRHGSTVGIASRIADRLRQTGLEVECRPVAEVNDVDRYDAFVVGGAAYMFHWLKPATAFVKRHRRVLAQRPVWLFSSGPLGTDLVDEQGRDIFEVTRPREFDSLESLVHPVGTRIFFGAWDPGVEPVGFGERMMRFMPAAKDALPAGDFRDWDAIDRWAEEIASALAEKASTGG